MSQVRIRRIVKTLGATLLMAGLLFANVYVASAHQWGSWHWNKGGTQIVVNQYNYASSATYQDAENARVNAWNTIGILYNYAVTSHTDVSVYDEYNTANWGGLASIESYNGSHITHVHSRYNTRYGTSNHLYIQGVYCQEVGHAWGLDHSATNDCMGLGYYYNNTYYYGAHNNTDFYNMYRYHPVQ